VDRFFPNSHSLSLDWNLATPSLSSQQKRTEKEKENIGD